MKKAIALSDIWAMVCLSVVSLFVASFVFEKDLNLLTENALPKKNEIVTPEITISDPCSCKNNATNSSNGQFGETIQITSDPGKTWTVTASSGFFAANSSNPPTLPLPLPAGTVFAEMPVGSGQYFLSGIHVDALGYSLTATSELGETLSISNSCAYPNPVVQNDLSGDFCLNTPPFTLVGQPGDANFASAVFRVDGQATTAFDPSALGIGPHIVEYIVDGGAPKAAGANDPGCVQRVSHLVNIVATPDQLVCNNLVRISLDSVCTVPVNPDMVLEGSYGCYDDYTVSLATPTGQNIGNIITPAQIGQTLTATVTHLPSGNTCWGYIAVEDKLAPHLACADVTLSCIVEDYAPEDLAVNFGLANVFPDNMPFPAPGVSQIGPNSFSVSAPTVNLFENCSDIVLTYSDAALDFPCNTAIGNLPDVSRQVVRTWTAVDASGNVATCVQNLFFERIHATDVHFPTDTVFSCDQISIADPVLTGAPYITFAGQNFPIFPTDGHCQLQATYQDVLFDICDGSRKILRTWSVYDWCVPNNPPPPLQNPIVQVQLIKILDTTGPVFQCPLDTMVTTAAYSCDRLFDLPDITITDACSRIDTVIVRYSFGGIWNSLPDSTPVLLQTWPANNLWNPDTLAVVPPIRLPEGSVTFEYVVYDDCGNTSTCQFDVIVTDGLPPIANCQSLIVDTLTDLGNVYIPAEAFDDGSFANCAQVFFKVRRKVGGACQPNDKFLPLAAFCCDDVGDTVEFIVRVYDIAVPDGAVDTSFMAAESSDCITRVVVKDGRPPQCLAPANVTIACENYDPALPGVLAPSAMDNCLMDTILESRDFSLFDTICNRGTIFRRFTAIDASGLSSVCSQRIIIQYNQLYHVRFPDDLIIEGCTPNNYYNEPSYNRLDCERMRATYTDQIVSPAAGACYRIDRTWTVYNKCTYNPATACITVPNPMPQTAEDHPQNLLGPIVSPSNTAAPWAPTNVRLTPTAPTTTNFSQFWQQGANCYRYTQRIKVNDATPPVFTEPCKNINGCDASANDSLLWNDPAWFDPINLNQDLYEGLVDLSISTKDDCGGSNVNIGGFLFMNLDGDTIQESVLRLQDFPLNPGVVPYDNYQNPNFSGGVLTPFDQRPVPVNEKYRFALRQSVNAGVRTASIRWNTQLAPTTYVVPQLPYGKHTMRWVVTDGCGNTKTCESTFSVRECQKPTLICAQPLTVILNGNNSDTLFAIDFLAMADDNFTPFPLLTFGIREEGNGYGFPVYFDGSPITSLDFDCDDAGTHVIDLWVRDLAGNFDSCKTSVTIVDNGTCSGVAAPVTGNIRVNPDDPTTGARNVAVELNGVASAPISQAVVTDSLGRFAFAPVPVGGQYSLTATRDDGPLNGVSTFDLLLISKHILGTAPLARYRLLAADANHSGSVSSFDIVELRKLILGVYDELPNNTSWRFYPKNAALDTLNPFTALSEVLQLPAFSVGQTADFIAVKIGDVNGNAQPNNLQSADDRTVGTLFFDLENHNFRAGEEVAVHFSSPGKCAALQFTLEHKGLEFVRLQSHAPSGQPGVRSEHLAVFPAEDALTLAAENPGQADFTLFFRAKKDGSLARFLRPGSRITPAAAYGDFGEKMDIALRFREADGSLAPNGDFMLLQNAPNPVFEATDIVFSLPEASQATLTISDADGRTIKTLRGDFAAGWNAISLKKSELPAGVLFYRLETAGRSEARKMVVMD